MERGGGKPAVFLDRDGVLNVPLVRDGKPYAPRDIVDFVLYDEVASCLTRLRAEGYILIVVTNQPDIGNGLVEEAAVQAMNDLLRRAVPVDEIIVCPHAQTAGCDCRKPRPGMLRGAAARHGIDLSASVLVGDRASDIGAGKAAGCRTIFIDRGYAESPPAAPDAVVASLEQAVRIIVSSSRKTLPGGTQ